MSIYLTIFGKPRYLGLMNVKDETTFEDGRAGWVVVKTMRGYEMDWRAGSSPRNNKRNIRRLHRTSRTLPTRCCRTSTS